MKKIFVLTAMVILVALPLVACGDTNKTPKNEASKTAVSENSEAESTEPISGESVSSKEKKLELENDGEYIVCSRSGDSVVINSVEDFKNYKVGYIDECDSMRYAEFYTFKETVLYNAAHDAHSGLFGKTVDLIIIDKISYKAFSDLDIVWDFSN